LDQNEYKSEKTVHHRSWDDISQEG
jgi:hypothetical protein